MLSLTENVNINCGSLSSSACMWEETSPLLALTPHVLRLAPGAVSTVQLPHPLVLSSNLWVINHRPSTIGHGYLPYLYMDNRDAQLQPSAEPRSKCTFTMHLYISKI